MADITLEIESGEKEIELKNKTRGLSVKVIVAVYDILFIGRIMEAAERLDALRKELNDSIPENPTDEQFREFFHKTQKVDPEMREIVDGLFDVPVCNTLFPYQSMFTYGDGAQTWENILYAVIDQMNDGLNAEKDKAKARIRKYSEKYKRK